MTFLLLNLLEKSKLLLLVNDIDLKLICDILIFI